MAPRFNTSKSDEIENSGRLFAACFTKNSHSPCEMGYIGVRYRPFRMAIWVILKAEMTLFAGSKRPCRGRKGASFGSILLHNLTNWTNKSNKANRLRLHTHIPRISGKSAFVFKFAKFQRLLSAKINSLKVCLHPARGCGVVPDGRVQGQRRVAPGMKSCRAVIG